MEIITDPIKGAQFLKEAVEKRDTEDTSLIDVVLNEGSYMANVLTIRGQAVGVIIGGHSGLIGLYELKYIHDLKIVAKNRLKGIFTWPLIGQIARNRWARQNGAVSINRPKWFPKL